MSNVKKILYLTLVLMLLSFVLVGCGGGNQTDNNTSPNNETADNSNNSADQANTRDAIVVALQGEPTTLDPQFPDDGNMRPVSDNIFDRLVELDGKTLEPVPSLALSWESKDDTTWEFKLRQDVKFQNGDPFTAEDAVFSIKRIIDPNYKSQIAPNFNTIADAKVIDDNIIQIITKGPDPILLKRLSHLDMVDKEYTEANPDKVASEPVGTGPYKFVSWNRGVDIKVIKNDNYWGEAPTIKDVTYRFIEEGATRLNALKTGEIDFAVNMLPEYIDQLPQSKTETGIETYFIRFNTLRGIMQNKLLREAANYAIDRDALADSLFQGLAKPAQGQLAKPGYFGFNSDLKTYPYDPAKAKELLQQAGYNGEPIQMISERGRWLKDGEVSEAVASMLRDAGFNIDLKFISFQEWLDVLFDKNKAPDMQFSSNGNEFFDMDRFYSAIIRSDGSQSNYNNSEIDKQIDAARNEMDEAKRLEMYKQLSEEVYTDNPFGIPLLNMVDIYGLAKDLQWEPRGDSRIFISEISFK